MTALHMGVDENGLGPRLGPLLVTAAAARLGEGGRALLAPLPSSATLRPLLGDSKALVSFGDSALGEAWARALWRQQHQHEPSSPGQLIEAILHEPATLRAPCPAEQKVQCWGDSGERFAADDALVERCSQALLELSRGGLHLVGFDSTLACVRVLNDGKRRGVSRLKMDLHAMETLVLARLQRERQQEPELEIDAVLGKVGGYTFYGREFGPLARHLHTALEEARPCSSYRFAEIGQLSFVRDADASHTLVALASLVGKWLRDTFMHRIVRHHEQLVGEALPRASGYHDPVTARFVERTALVRQQRAFPDDCFEREAAQKAPKAAPTKRASAKRSPTPEAEPLLPQTKARRAASSPAR